MNMKKTIVTAEAGVNYASFQTCKAENIAAKTAKKAALTE
jgi:hypothetical protein